MFYSGMAGESDRMAGIAAGANEYLVKPNDLETISHTVKKLLCEKSTQAKRNYPEKIESVSVLIKQ